MAHLVVVGIKVHKPNGEIVDVPVEKLVVGGLAIVGPNGETRVVSVWEKPNELVKQYIGFPLELTQEVRQVDAPGEGPKLPRPDLKVA